MSDSGTTSSEFLGYIFEDRDFDNHPALQDIKDNIKGILSRYLSGRHGSVSWRYPGAVDQSADGM